MNASKTFLALFIGMTLTGAAIILLIPSLFEPHEPYLVWAIGILGGLFVVLAVGVLYLRPAKPPPPEQNAGE
ncbi:hypothetical protein ER308_02190 [Egibacter rhizosphaerae]|uniref:Uncharacterized protein n=1 Tax=Egibacter rhizosphaerae TaxID=1670831 RepID=A0A411YBE6_9ACTN|nr:hypothetical protein [Egibacter rhizosphaerae]QBI18492.1 hypothetical protein ER308_02190 [Egibacter rhizosphaerae]